MSEQVATASPSRSRGGLALRWGLSILLLAGVAWQLAKSREYLMAHPVSLAPLPFLGSLLGVGLFLMLGCELWRRLLGGLGHSLSYRQAFGALFISNLGKYLPGSVWNLLGRVVLCERMGVPKLATSISLLMETACQVVAALLVALLTLPCFAAGTPIADARLLGAAVLAVAVGMHPRLLNLWLAVGQRLIGKELPRLPFSYGFVLAVLSCYTLNWLLLGASFALLGQSMTGAAFAPTQIGILIGGFAISWNVGVFALFTPAGLGAREAALVLLLGSAFPPGWPAALALVSRLWFVLAEFIAFLLAFWSRRELRKN
jgi:hypothetical protein